MVRSQSKYLFVASGEKVTCFLPDDDRYSSYSTRLWLRLLDNRRVIGPDSVWGALDVCTKDTFISSLSLPFALLPYNGKLNGKPLPSSLIKDMFDVGPPSGWRGPRIATLDVNGTKPLAMPTVFLIQFNSYPTCRTCACLGSKDMYDPRFIFRERCGGGSQCSGL